MLKLQKKSGAEVPFIRQKKLSTDKVSVNDVLYDAIINSKTQNEPFHACVFSTSILIKRKIIFNAIQKINSSNYDNIIAIKKFENHPLKSLYLKKDKIYLNWNAKLQNTQEYKDLYHDAGYFYLFKTKNFVKTKKLLNNKTSYIKLLKNESIDIDTKDDFEIAKYIYKYNLSKNE